MTSKLVSSSILLRASASIRAKIVLNTFHNPARLSRFASTLVLDEVRDILPPKSLVKLYLFQHRIPLSYNKVIQSYAACWGTNEDALPSGVTGADLVRLKNVLESHRKKTGAVTKVALKLEANLIERAAELGDHTAIALLCGRTLLSPVKPNLSPEQAEQDEQDRAHAMKLLNQLADELHFPLAFKIKGDIAYKLGRHEKAEELYQSCVEYLPEPGTPQNDSNTTTLRVECLRTVGIIRFKAYDVSSARACFELAVLAAENGTLGNPAQAMDCHYYLGQIAAESDKKRARYHLEQAAKMGLKEAFAPLGFLLLNVFGQKDLAREWFDLGASIGEQTAMIGQYDVAILDNDMEKAATSLKKIKKSILDGENAAPKNNDSPDAEKDQNQLSSKETFTNIMKSRARSLEKVEKYIAEHHVTFDTHTIAKTASQTETSAIEKSNPDLKSKPRDNSRWGF